LITMTFNEKIIISLDQIIAKHRLAIVEQHENYLKFNTDKITLIIVYNKLENSCVLWIGKIDGEKVEIDNDVLKDFFHSQLRLNQVSQDVFISNLITFFENEATPILTGDNVRLDELEKFDRARSKAYTIDLILRQMLAKADAAWESQKFKEFIVILDSLDEIPLSYWRKYKIAQQKLPLR
jgi:hypothetical protein